MTALARQLLFVIAVAAFACTEPPANEPPVEPVAANDSTQPLHQRIPPPEGFQRVTYGAGSFGAWLRDLPVKPGRPPVMLHDGRRKSNQSAHHAVLDIDVGVEDLQQCADAVIRLRAEYLLSGSCGDEIQFNFTSGDAARWVEWRSGIRPVVKGNQVSWKRSAPADDSYAGFREYLDTVFMYAGSASLEHELSPVHDPSLPVAGDVFIHGGFPGHAVLVIDVAVNDAGDRAFLLAQSYMPAQEIHILRSPEDVGPWYRAAAAGALRTPEWEFKHGDLRRFSPSSCESATRGAAR